MALTAAQLADRKRKMQSILAKGDGDQVQAVQGALPTYSVGRKVMSPQAIRPKTDQPGQRLQKWVQAALMATLGVRLPLNGVIDAQTRAALLQFQRMAGIPVSGAVDARTLRELEFAVGLPAPRQEPTAPPPDGLLQRVAKATDQPKTTDKQEHQAGDAPRHTFEGAANPQYGEADAHQLRQGQPRAEAKVDPQLAAMQRFLHAEGMQAVLSLAVDRAWLREELQRSGRQGETALLAEMLGWWERARAPSAQPPAWMTEVAKLAQDNQAEAVAKVRQAWQKEQGGAGARSKSPGAGAA